MLEATQHAESTFVTLTYSEQSLPKLPLVGGLLPTLQRKDVVGFLKRLRANVSPVKFRFFGCGEYGEQTERPHYHLLLFGLPTCARGRTGAGYLKPAEHWRECCASCRRIGEAWGHGIIFQGQFTRESAQYVAGYTVKKMTAKDDDRLGGRHPEFAMMSLRPGIGAWAMEDVALTIMQHPRLAKQADVPTALVHGKRPMPQGRYLRRQLRQALGREPGAPERIEDEEMRLVRENQVLRSIQEETSVRKIILQDNAAANLSLDVRFEIHERKKPL